jgi:hypothetical protein
MPSITATRPVLEERFPVLGFTVRTGVSPSWFEVALATDPSLFGPEGRSKRTPQNFYSSRAGGPLPAPRGEAVYLVPADVAARFAGQGRLYYQLAVAPTADLAGAQPVVLPAGLVPSISISRTFTGRSRRLQIAIRGGVGAREGYGQVGPDSLTWAGDAAAPGKSVPVKNGAPAAAPAAPAPAPNAAAPAKQAALDSAYSDGYDDDFWETAQDAVEDDGEGADAGIDAPIPDAAATDGASTDGAGMSLALAAPDYSGASRFVQAKYFGKRDSRTIRRIVIHITDGGPKVDGTIAWFLNPVDKDGKVRKVSAHYIVGQDGTIVQMVKENDIAWHAHTANGDSIGIEHCANKKGLNPSDVQYCASAALVRSLCEKYGIDMRRVAAGDWGDGVTGIQGHKDADPNTDHDCPSKIWDWDYYLDLVTSATCHPRATAQSLGVKSRSARPLDDTLQPGDVVTVKGKKYVIYDSEVRTGGVWAWVNNNPGNITKSGEAESYGAYAGKGNGGFAIFPDYATGFAAILSFLRKRQEKTISQMMAIYAPPDDGKNPMLKGNDPVAYARAIGKKLGVGVDTKVKDLSDDQLNTFASEIERIETGPKGTGTVYTYDDPALPAEIRDRLPAPAASDSGDAGADSTQQAYAGVLGIQPADGTAVDRMKAAFVANSSGGSQQNCITIANSGLRQLFGAKLKNDDGSAKALGSTIQDTMAALQGYGLAQAAQVFEFEDSSGRITKGVARPDHLHESVETWLLNQADANAASGWYVFGLSLMDGYHSVVLAVNFSGIGDPSTKVYWADQIYSGWDDVTGGADARITRLIQGWWDKLPANKKARTRVTVWPLNA